VNLFFAIFVKDFNKENSIYEIHGKTFSTTRQETDSRPLLMERSNMARWGQEPVFLLGMWRG
jgi:hypothetical protein